MKNIFDVTDNSLGGGFPWAWWCYKENNDEIERSLDRYLVQQFEMGLALGTVVL